jgi:DNA-binding NtrC family response regulator
MEQTVLVIDDDEICREAVGRHLNGLYRLRYSETVQAARACIAGERLDCVLLDFRLPDGDGLSLLPSLVSYQIPVIMCTSQGNEQVAVQALQDGAQDYLVKNTLNRSMLHRAITNAIERSRLRAELLLREQEKDALISQLQAALRDNETLRGLLSICARCKKIRDDEGEWQSVESYIIRHSQARFTHGFCPVCFEQEVKAIREEQA